MATTTIASAAVGPPLTSSERWTSYSALVLAICILGWAFDIYEATIMQLVTPIASSRRFMRGSSRIEFKARGWR